MLPPEAAQIFCLRNVTTNRAASQANKTQILSTPEWRKNKRKKEGKQRKNKPLNPEPQRSHSALLASYLSLIVKNHVVDKLCCGVDKHGGIALVTVHACSGYAQWTQYVVVFLRRWSVLSSAPLDASLQAGSRGHHADWPFWVASSTRRSSELNCVAHVDTAEMVSAGQASVSLIASLHLPLRWLQRWARRAWTQRAPAKWGVLHRGDIQPSHRLWAQSTRQPVRQLRLIRDFCSDPPGWIRRHRHWTVVLVRCGTRRWAYWKSALFTTVHSGERRTSELETDLSLSWGKFVASSVLFHTHKYGETRIRTMFRFVSKTEMKSRPGKRANQDSPWKTKRAYSCWGQIWDPEARTSSRVWANGFFHRVWAIQARSITTSKENYQKNKIGIFLKLVSTVFMRWKNWREFKDHVSMKFSRRRLIENQDTVNELTARIQELQNEVNCMNDSPDFKDAESVRSGPSHVPSQPAFFFFFILSWSWEDAKSQQSAARYLEFAWYRGNVFANPPASSPSPYPGGFNPWISDVMEDTPVLTSTRGRTRYMWWTSNSRHSLKSEISDRTVSRKFIRPWRVKILK